MGIRPRFVGLLNRGWVDAFHATPNRRDPINAPVDGIPQRYLCYLSFSLARTISCRGLRSPLMQKGGL